MNDLILNLNSEETTILKDTFLYSLMYKHGSLDEKELDKINEVSKKYSNILYYLLDNKKKTGDYFDDVIPSLEYIVKNNILMHLPVYTNFKELNNIIERYADITSKDIEFKKIFFVLLMEFAYRKVNYILTIGKNIKLFNMYDFYDWCKNENGEFNIIKDKLDKFNADILSKVKRQSVFLNMFINNTLGYYNDIVDGYFKYKGITNYSKPLDNIGIDDGFYTKGDSNIFKIEIHDINNILYLYMYDNMDKLVLDGLNDILYEKLIAENEDNNSLIYLRLAYMKDMSSMLKKIEEGRVIFNDKVNVEALKNDLNLTMNSMLNTVLYDEDGNYDDSNIALIGDSILTYGNFTNDGRGFLTSDSRGLFFTDKDTNNELNTKHNLFGVRASVGNKSIDSEYLLDEILSKYFRDNGLVVGQDKIRLYDSEDENGDKFYKKLGSSFINSLMDNIIITSKIPAVNGKSYFNMISKYIDLDSIVRVDNKKNRNYSINMTSYDRNIKEEDIHDFQKDRIDFEINYILKNMFDDKDFNLPLNINTIIDLDLKDISNNLRLFNILNQLPLSMLSKYIDLDSIRNYKMKKSEYNKIAKKESGSLGRLVVDTVIRFPKDVVNKDVQKYIFETGFTSLTKTRLNTMDYSNKEFLAKMLFNMENIDITILDKKSLETLGNVLSDYVSDKVLEDSSMYVMEKVLHSDNARFDIEANILDFLENDKVRVEKILKSNDINLKSVELNDTGDGISSLIYKDENGKKIPDISVDKIYNTYKDLKTNYIEDVINQPNVIEIENVTEDLDICNELSMKLYKTQNFKHGNVASIVKKIYDVNMDRTKFEEFVEQDKNNPRSTSKGKPREMLFHGTGSIAANFIAKFGFKVLEASTPGVVGRMLGDGIYFASNIDKSLSYIGNAGFKKSYKDGYILICDVCLGEKGNRADYVYVSSDDGVLSEEWCVFKADQQVIIKQIVLLESVSIGQFKEHMNKYNIKV